MYGIQYVVLTCAIMNDQIWNESLKQNKVKLVDMCMATAPPLSIECGCRADPIHYTFMDIVYETGSYSLCTGD